MHRVAAVAVRAFVVVGLTAAGAAGAADKLQGTFGLDAHKETLAHGLAWVDAKGVVSVGFYTGDLVEAKDQARAMKGEGGIYGLFDKPNVTIDMRIKPGTAAAAPAALESCSIVFMGFALGPFTWNADNKGCAVVELRGALKPGGVLHGKFKGQAEALPRSDGHKPIYSWDLDFTVTLRAKP